MSQGIRITQSQLARPSPLIQPDQLITNFHSAIDKIVKHTGELFPHDRTCSIEFEGNDLLQILAQEGARNIRFYFALHLKDYPGKKKDHSTGQIKPHLTLIAVGIDDQGNEMRPASKVLPPQVPKKAKAGQTGAGILFEYGFPCPPDC
ncbi:MAG: hypothetical protein IPQ13_10475 [Holophagaceae bacterium]|nr:hypothetical protein [Holophagaceae bacterium]